VYEGKKCSESKAKEEGRERERGEKEGVFPYLIRSRRVRMAHMTSP